MAPIDALNPVPQRRLSDIAAEQLRHAIRNGSLPPGTRLVERQLAEQLAMSRIPVREAIQQLSEEGLVKKVPHRGTFVYSPSRDELEQIASLRIVLERFVIERVIARWQPRHEVQLGGIVDQMERAASRGEHRRVFELDGAFHFALWQIADHDILLEVISELRSRISRFLYETTVALSPSELDSHAAGHRNIVQVLNSGDVTAAVEEITKHVIVARERILA